MPNKKKTDRLDNLLIRRGLAESLVAARALIMSGSVIVNDQRVDKPGVRVDESSDVRLKGHESRFVSRGGEKLSAAISALGIEDAFVNRTILDVGASTGGFTDCLLQLGAQCSIALDVGTAQLDWKLRQDPRVISVEQTDIREFKANNYPSPDWVVADLSFTSLSKIIPFLQRAAPNARLLLLVKPQFELPREKIPSGGIVTNEEDRLLALKDVLQALHTQGYIVEKWIDSPLTGRQGNREIFVLTGAKA